MHKHLTRPVNSCGLYSVLINIMIISWKQKNSLKNVEDTHECLGPYHQFQRDFCYRVLPNSVPSVIESNEDLTQSFTLSMSKWVRENESWYLPFISSL